MFEMREQQVPDGARSELDLEEDLDEEELQRKQIARRLGLGAVLIVILLGVLFLTDAFNAPVPRDPEPVPIPRPEESAPQTIGQSVTGPVTPVEPVEPEPIKTPEPAPKAEEPPPPPAAVEQAPMPAPAPPARLSPRPHVSSAPRAIAPSPAPAPVAPREPTVRPVQTAPTAPPATRPVPPALPSLLHNYSLQAGVFSSTEKAEELHAKLTLNGIPSTLETRVRVGPFNNKAEADAARAKLKALGVESLMLPPRK